jgi:hypothetical protein
MKRKMKGTWYNHIRESVFSRCEEARDAPEAMWKWAESGKGGKGNRCVVRAYERVHTIV